MNNSSLVDVLQESLGVTLTSKTIERLDPPSSLLRHVAEEVQEFYSNYSLPEKQVNELPPCLQISTPRASHPVTPKTKRPAMKTSAIAVTARGPLAMQREVLVSTRGAGVGIKPGASAPGNRLWKE